MALVKCKECGSEISNKAAVCPRCGAKPRRTSGCAWLVLILFGLLIIPPMFSGFDGARDRAAVRTARPTAQEPSATPKPENSSNRHSDYDSGMEVKARRAVKAALRDPDSAQFRDIRYGDSEETGPAIFGFVNSKNAFGGYSGFVKFVSNGTTTLIEGRDPKTGEAWQKLHFAAVTEKTLAELPQSSQALPVQVDVPKLAGKTDEEVNAILGQPSSREKIKEGNQFDYKTKDIEVVFTASKANQISISNLKGIPFTPSAITALGLPMSKPSFASDFVLRWKNIQGIAEVSFLKGEQGNCVSAYICVKEGK